MGLSLSLESQRILLRAKIKPGSIIHIFCNFIKKPDNKFCVIVHTDYKEGLYLIFLINSNIVNFIKTNPELCRAQLPLYKADYQFFSKEVSYLNCAEYFDQLLVDEVVDHLISVPNDFKGMLNKKEIQKIIQIVHFSKTISPIEIELIINSLDN